MSIHFRRQKKFVRFLLQRIKRKEKPRLMPRKIEDITWPRVDMNFTFECSTRYRIEHEKIKFISTSGQVIFCLLYKRTNDDVFDDFPKISDHLPKNSEDFPKLFFRTFSNIFRTFSEDYRKISKDNRRFPRKDRWCFDDTATHLSTF